MSPNRYRYEDLVSQIFVFGDICQKPQEKKKKYIYIYAVEFKTGPILGVSSVKNWSKSSVKN